MNDHLMSFTFISHLLKSVCFFISQSIIICLDHLHLILLRHIIADIELYLIILCHYLLHCFIDLIDLHYKHQNFIMLYKYQHLHQIHIYAPFVSLNKTELFFPHSIRLYES